uniref:Uncharacterized protein n=1 Tax=Varanus komodoensis TaxID=61221 RepID=A0A8D2LUI7_VARKO
MHHMKLYASSTIVLCRTGQTQTNRYYKLGLHCENGTMNPLILYENANIVYLLRVTVQSYTCLLRSKLHLVQEYLVQGTVHRIEALVIEVLKQTEYMNNRSTKY